MRYETEFQRCYRNPDVNEVYFGEEPTSLIRMKNQHKKQSVTECGKCGSLDKKITFMCCHEVEAVKYFELLGKRYGDANAVALHF